MSFCHAGFMQVGHELLSAKASLTHSRQNVWPQGRLYESRRKPLLRRCVDTHDRAAGVVGNESSTQQLMWLFHVSQYNVAN